MRTRPILATLTLALVLASRPAAAQIVDDAARAAARQLGYDGVHALQAGNLAAATDQLERAYAVLKVPSLGLWSARALDKAGRLVAASERYLEVSRLAVPDVEAEVHRKAQADAQVELQALLPRLGHLVIAVSPALPVGASVLLDGRVVPAAVLGADLPVDPGTRHVELRTDARVETHDLLVGEGQHQRVELVIPSGPVAAPSPRPEPMPLPPSPHPTPLPVPPAPASHGSLRTAAWITVGVGAAGVVFGAIIGGVAAGENSSLNGVCTGNVCPQTSTGAVDTYTRNRGLSIAGLWAGGGVLAAGGAYLLLTPRRPDGPALSAWIGAASLGLEGRY